MRTYNLIEITQIFKNNSISVFTLADFARLFNINNQNTVYKKIQRLERQKIIEKLIKGKYRFNFTTANDFLIANFLYQPSYISLESALSFYSIITGFPYKITSLTIKKTKSFFINNKNYRYAQISKDLFWGYEKKEDFLIAQPEKSLIDYLYLSFKGLRGGDISEFDLSKINKIKLKNDLSMIKNKQFLKFLGEKL